MKITTQEEIQEKFEHLRISPDFPEDSDLRLDDFGYIIERHSYGAINSFGWRMKKDGTVIGSITGTKPLMG